MGYLTTVSVDGLWTITRRMNGRQMNDEVERVWEKATVA
jgi:hypothetical protein